MVYHLVRFIFFLAIHNFYRIKVRHGNLVPTDKPLIIASNHTNAFLDSLSMAITIKQKMYSLPRGNIFLTSSKMLTWLFNEIRMIPIFRKLEGSEHLKRNDETFERCFQIIKDKGTIHIYPEAICIYERRLKSIKKGAARILLGAEERNGFSLGSQVIICGLIYEEASRFNSNLLFNFSRPFSIDQSIAIYKENNVLGINHLSNLIGEKMLPNMVHIENKQLDQLVSQVEIVYKTDLCAQYGFNQRNQSHGFFLSREIANGINFHYQLNPDHLFEVGGKLSSYLNGLKTLGVKDHQVYGFSYMRTLLYSIAFLLFSPLYVWGMLNHLIPLLACQRIADNVVKRIEFRGSVLLLSWVCILLVYYPLMILLSYLITKSLVISVIYGMTLPILGRIAFLFSRACVELGSDILFMIKSLGIRIKIREFKSQREKVLTDLNYLKNEYRNRHTK